MSFIDITYYKTDYLGTDPNDDIALARYIARADDDINMMIQYQVPTVDQYPLVQKASAAQVEWYVNNGDDYNDRASSSESIGSYSRNGVDSMTVNKICPRSRSYLEQTGLLFRGVKIIPLGRRHV